MAEIIWSPVSQTDYWENISYLLEKWTDETAISFMDKVDAILELISGRPKMFQRLGFSNIHFVPVVSQITLYYRIIDANNIELVRFWNNFQNPEELIL